MGLELALRYAAGQTPIDDSELNGLKIKLITTQQELDQVEQLNIEKAIAWTIRGRFSKTEILTEAFVKKLHRLMLGDVWAWAGEFRKSEKNIGIP